MPEFGSYPEKESPAAGDFLLVLDGDDDATKKVDVGNLPGLAATSWLHVANATQENLTGDPDLSWLDFGATGFGVVGNDLEVAAAPDDRYINVLTTGVYAVTIISYATGIDHGSLYLSSVDPTSGHNVPYVWDEDNNWFYAAFAWTGAITEGTNLFLIEPVVSFEGTWTFIGNDLRIHRLA